jgi:hypothetical protein
MKDQLFVSRTEPKMPNLRIEQFKKKVDSAHYLYDSSVWNPDFDI